MTWSADLEVVNRNPPNAGTPLRAQTGALLDAASVYVRSNFPVPEPGGGPWRVEVGRKTLGLDEIMAYGCEEVAMALECAGNGRTLMEPTPGGTPWTLGGASAVRFAGAPLAPLLREHLDLTGAAEVVFTGVDGGRVPEDGRVPYQFCLTVEEAMASHAILAWEMAGEPLTPEHGAPLRLVVPGQYAMKSVKWLARIEALAEPFMGHFVRKYRYYGDAVEPEAAPVGDIQVRSLIASPAEGAGVPAGPLAVAGMAWSRAPIARVEVSADGTTWAEASLTEPAGPYAPTGFSCVVEVGPGPAVLTARATDTAGNAQPLSPRWNANGYANNVVHRVRVTAT